LLEDIKMTTMIDVAKQFGRDEEGASLAEYGLLLALIAVVCIAAVSLLGTSITSMFNTVASTI
jgi:pilus assembly protein Flp/PilA